MALRPLPNGVARKVRLQRKSWVDMHKTPLPEHRQREVGFYFGHSFRAKACLMRLWQPGLFFLPVFSRADRTKATLYIQTGSGFADCAIESAGEFRMFHTGAFPDTANFFGAAEHHCAIGSNSAKPATGAHGNGCTLTIWTLVFTSDTGHSCGADKCSNGCSCDNGPKNFSD